MSVSSISHCTGTIDIPAFDTALIYVRHSLFRLIAGILTCNSPYGNIRSINQTINAPYHDSLEDTRQSGGVDEILAEHPDPGAVKELLVTESPLLDVGGVGRLVHCHRTVGRRIARLTLARTWGAHRRSGDTL